MSVFAIHHVQLAMPEGREAEAVEFYEELLGIPQVPQPPHLQARGGCWFESEALRIHLGVDRNFTPAEKAHPALLTKDLLGMRRRLVEAGVQVADDQALPGFNRFYARDPFGNRIEFLEPFPPDSNRHRNHL